MTDNIKVAREYLQKADAIFITSGAGMSVDSGLPDYRSNLGIIAQLNKKNYNYNDLSDPKAFLENAEYSWGWYAEHILEFLNAQPHEGYKLIKNFIDKKNLDYFLFTSNVDCMWKKAGFDKDRLIEYHGSLDYLQSLSKNGPVWSLNIEEIKNIQYNPQTYKCVKSTIPISKYDNQYARPNVCFFNDGDYFNTSRFDKVDRKYSHWYMNNANTNKRLVVLEIGAGTIVPTVREASENMVKEHLSLLKRNNINNENIHENNIHEYGKLIRINPTEYDVPDGQISIPLTGLKALKMIFS
jgi:NAD-dependent SIR2 family protein deacetylase